jgi:hypothetical protein
MVVKVLDKQATNIDIQTQVEAYKTAIARRDYFALKQQLDILQKNTEEVIASQDMSKKIIDITINVGLFKRMAEAYIKENAVLFENN